MAGIEKTCEFSGINPGGVMYNWKNNSIQVNPEYYKEFHKQPHTLYIWIDGMHGRVKYRDRHKPVGNAPMTIRNYGYCLYVPSVPGIVGGEYVNWSHDIRAVKHHIRKILGLCSIAHLNTKRIADSNSCENLIMLDKTYLTSCASLLNQVT